jgi:hypothetical protein
MASPLIIKNAGTFSLLPALLKKQGLSLDQRLPVVAFCLPSRKPLTILMMVILL